MVRFQIWILLCFLSGSAGAQTPALQEYSASGHAMGSAFQITAIAEDSELAHQAVEAAYAEVERIEALISSWRPGSETSAINRNAGVAPVKVSDELFDLIGRSKKVSELTGGVFDISFASIDKAWHFDGTMEGVPTAEEIQRSVALIDYRNIILDSDASTVYLAKKDMKIGFGGIGKGYAANRCKHVMEAMGIRNGLVNAGGDLITWGRQADGSAWTIGIADPRWKNSAFSWLTIDDMAVVTSGDYEHFIEVDGKRYCHIINPLTGWPAEMLTSVTIICPDAELADALATAVFVMGPSEGIAFVNGLAQVACLVVDGEGRIFHSDNISLNYYGKP